MSESLFNKVADPKAWNFIKKKLKHKCFPVKFAKVFKSTYFEEHPLTAVSVWRASLFGFLLFAPQDNSLSSKKEFEVSRKS